MKAQEKAKLTIQSLREKGNDLMADSLELALLKNETQVHTSMAEGDGVWVYDPETRTWHYIYI